MTTDVADHLDAVRASAQSLEHTLADLSDVQVAEPSLLPGWTRGHVFTHLARNADALRNLIHWARTGEETPMYPGREQRDADIEAGAGRTAAELRADVHETQQRLMADLDGLTDQQWQTRIRWGHSGNEASARVIPHLRRVEIEVHHVDLDLDYTLAHWPEEFVEQMLAQVTADFGARPGIPGFVLMSNENDLRWTVGPGGQQIMGTPPSLLGWLIGRTDGIGLHSEEALPELEAWK